MTVTSRQRPDWKAERERVDLAAVATGLLGPAPGRRGERGRKLWWSCPLGTHEDRNPSFAVDPGKRRWKCFGCGASGDAAALVMRVRGATFPEALAFLTGGPAPLARSRPRPAAGPERPPEPSGMPGDAALALVEAAFARLWSPEGADALAYLTGPGRCLSAETIRAARLGCADRIQARTHDGRPYIAGGMVIPWWDGPALTLVKVRQSDGRGPKYAEVFRDRHRPGGIYPGPEAIRPGHPVIVAEGEFDALALGEAVGGLAAVVTLGSASARPEAAALGAMLAAPRWFLATDADPAGDEAAEGWPAHARRVRPPAPFKDWTEAKAAGVDLARWWRDVLAGSDRPPLFTWDELTAMRWGPAVGDPEPGIVFDRTDLARMPAEPHLEARPDQVESLARFLDRLESRGIRLDGRLVYPRLCRGLAGRVHYAGPALQGLPKADRLRRLGPVVAGRAFVRADYGQIEPRILLEVLRRRGLIAWDAGADLYRDLIGDGDRGAAKVAVNRVINGGRPDPGSAGRMAGFVAAVEVYRALLADSARASGVVETLSGRPIPLSPDEGNHGGKAVHRVVQGTASDVFGRATLGTSAALGAGGLPAAVAFLLHDELWVECEPGSSGRVAGLMRREMAAAAAAEGLAIPVGLEGPVPSDIID